MSENKRLFEQSAAVPVRVPSHIAQRNQPPAAWPTALLLSRHPKSLSMSDDYGQLLLEHKKNIPDALTLQFDCTAAEQCVSSAPDGGDADASHAPRSERQQTKGYLDCFRECTKAARMSQMAGLSCRLKPHMKRQLCALISAVRPLLEKA